MAYTKQTWEDGKSIANAQRLNHIEDGIQTIDKANTYSTDEIVVGTYLGKPLYRKVIKVDNLSFPAGVNTNIRHNIATIEFVPNLTYDFYYSGDNSHYIDWDGIINKKVNNTNIILTTSSNSSTTFTNWKITIEYTKTTD